MKMRFQAIALLVLFLSQKAWTCQHGDIRLLNQRDLLSRCYYRGRVEVCLSGNWSTLCVDYWSSIDAGVACTQLGHSRNGSTASFLHNYYWPTSQPQIHLNCSGSEIRLVDCQHSNKTCFHPYYAAGVRCRQVVTGCPQNAEITVQSPTTLNISWSPPHTVYGTIWWYRVICSGSSASHSNHTWTSSILTLAMVGLRPYTHYTCCISAVTTVDVGTAVCNSTVTSEAAPTAAPQNVRGTTGSTSLHCKWSPPPSQHRNGLIRYYQVHIIETNTNMQISSGFTHSTFWRASPLHPYTSYQCRVAAVTVAQGPSATITLRTKETAPTAAPQSVRANTSSTSLVCNWSPPPTQYQNGQIQYYRVYIAEVNPNRQISSGTTQSTSWNISSLRPYTVYRCTVAAFTVAQGPSAFITIRTNESAPTAAPQNVNGSATGSSSLSLYWSPPPSHQQNGRIQYYHINVTDETTNTHTSFRAYNTQWAISNLHPYTSYLCGVAAVTVSKGPSAFITIRTNESVPTVSPTVNSTVRRNATAILITLQPLIQRESGGVITHYNIRYRGFEPLGLTCSRSNLTMSTTPAVTYMDGLYVQLLVSQLDPRLSYCLEVAAATSVGVGPSSEPIAVGLYSNDPFQVHLSGDLHCDHWLAYRPLSKWAEISQAIAGAIQRWCYCPFTSEYIADGRLMCSGNDSIVFQGRIITTDSPTNTELLEYLQEWVRSTPTVIIEGVHLNISNCSVHLNELGSIEANCTEPAVASGLSEMEISFIITAIVLLMIIIVASTVICSVYCWKKRTITEEKRDNNPSKGDTDDVDEPKTCNEYSTQHSIRKGRKSKSTVKQETVELTCRKLSGAAVAQDTSLPHPHKDKCLPTLPPRLYLEDEDFISQLHNSTMQNTIQEKAVCFEVHGNVIQTPELPSPTADENAIYQPLLPSRMVTEESSESSVYQPLTLGGTNKESMQSVTENENSAYQPLTFKSATANREQNGEESGQWIMPKESSETSHYQPLVFPKGKPKLHPTHVMMAFYDK